MAGGQLFQFTIKTAGGEDQEFHGYPDRRRAGFAGLPPNSCSSASAGLVRPERMSLLLRLICAFTFGSRNSR
jgi:hypothetical protein